MGAYEMIDEIRARAKKLKAEFGPDVDEALARWEASGAQHKDTESAPWLSVAFIFAREARA